MYVSVNKNMDIIYRDNESTEELVGKIITLITQSDMNTDQFFSSVILNIPVNEAVTVYATVYRKLEGANCIRFEKSGAEKRGEEPKRKVQLYIQDNQEGSVA